MCRNKGCCFFTCLFIAVMLCSCGRSNELNAKMAKYSSPALHSGNSQADTQFDCTVISIAPREIFLTIRTVAVYSKYQGKNVPLRKQESITLCSEACSTSNTWKIRAFLHPIKAEHRCDVHVGEKSEGKQNFTGTSWGRTRTAVSEESRRSKGWGKVLGYTFPAHWPCSLPWNVTKCSHAIYRHCDAAPVIRLPSIHFGLKFDLCSTSWPNQELAQLQFFRNVPYICLSIC